ARPIPRDDRVATNWPAISPGEPPKFPNAPGNHTAGQPPAGGPANKKETPAAGSGFVLRQGETLEYDANLTKLNSTIAHLKIVALEKRSAGGKASWHLQAFAHTENPYRM